MKHKYNVGDKVRIKSLDWYNMHCDDAGNVDCGCEIFEKDMKPYLGKVFTIHRIVDNSKYEMEEAFVFFLFTDEMIEGLVEDESSIDLTVKGEEAKERIEITIPEGYEYVIESGKIIFTKKKKEYPKTFEDCVSVLMSEGGNRMSLEQMNTFRKLIDARNAYWTIYGKENGLEKPWEPDWNDEKQDKYGLYEILKYSLINPSQFVFPTAEMRDAFYENFKSEI